MLNLLYNSIKKRWISIFLITINSVISVILLYNLLTSSAVHNINDKVINDYVKLNNTIMLKYEALNCEPEEVEKDINKIEDFLKDKNVKFGGYEYTNNSFKELESNEDYINRNKGIWKEDVAYEYPYASKFMYVSRYGLDFLTKKNDILEELKDYNETNSEIPVVVGYKYKDILSENQILTDNEGIKYRIIGFLNKNTSWLSKGDFYDKMPISLDDYFVMPLNKKSKFNEFAINAICQSYLIEASNYENMRSVKKEIQEFKVKNNINTDIIATADIISILKENQQNYIGFMSLISIMVIMFIIITNSISMISSIEDRKYDIAVMVSQGASNKFLILYVLIESILVFLSSFIVAMALNFFTHTGKILFIYVSKNFNVTNFIIVFVVSLFVCIISSVLPIKRILKINPSKLLME